MDMAVDLAPTTAVPTLLDIFFWVVNESNSALSISVLSTINVDALRDAVIAKKPKTFADVDPDKVVLWMVRHLRRSWSFLHLTNLDSSTNQSS
jgi:hypothetical protein